MQPQPSDKGPRRGFTLMIMGGPGQQPRRLHIPRWALSAAACGWLAVMAAAAWCGFYGGGGSKPGAARYQGSVAASSLAHGAGPER